MMARISSSFDQEHEMREKMRLFVSDASHELRTPLTSIRGFAEVLLMGRAREGGQVESSLQTIISETERLSRLVNNLLLLTRLEQEMETEMKPENLSEIIEESWAELRMMAENRSLQLKMDREAIINCNRDQILQLIFNLVKNSAQYTPDEYGQIEIIVEKNEIETDGFVALSIVDNGCGIPEEDIHRIFDRFYRVGGHRCRKNGGYGLGLSIVKSIADLHNAEINVESSIGKGTKISVHFPLFQQTLS
jgi:two-component system OmpR family sensor kinase